MSAPVGISGFLASSAPSLGYKRQNKTQVARHGGVPWVARSLAGLPSLHLSKCSYVYFTYTSGVLVVLSGRDRENMFISSSWKQCPHFLFLIIKILNIQESRIG